MLNNQTPSWIDIVADVPGMPAGSNVAPVKKEAAARPLRRPPTRVWDEIEVANRALELHDLECAVNVARSHMFDRANDFKEIRGISHVDLGDESFMAYTADALAAVVAAKREQRKARARLETACRRCPRLRVPRLKTPTPRMSKRTSRRLFGE